MGFAAREAVCDTGTLSGRVRGIYRGGAGMPGIATRRMEGGSLAAQLILL